MQVQILPRSSTLFYETSLQISSHTHLWYVTKTLVACNDFWLVIHLRSSLDSFASFMNIHQEQTPETLYHILYRDPNKILQIYEGQKGRTQAIQHLREHQRDGEMVHLETDIALEDLTAEELNWIHEAQSENQS